MLTWVDGAVCHPFVSGIRGNVGNVASFERERSARLAVDIVRSFATSGAMVARVDEVGDPELWRSVARKVAHENGLYVATGRWGPDGELVWAKLYDGPVTAADRQQARAMLEQAVFSFPTTPLF